MKRKISLFLVVILALVAFMAVPAAAEEAVVEEVDVDVIAEPDLEVAPNAAAIDGLMASDLEGLELDIPELTNGDFDRLERGEMVVKESEHVQLDSDEEFWVEVGIMPSEVISDGTARALPTLSCEVYIDVEHSWNGVKDVIARHVVGLFYRGTSFMSTEHRRWTEAATLVPYGELTLHTLTTEMINSSTAVKQQTYYKINTKIIGSTVEWKMQPNGSLYAPYPSKTYVEYSGRE